MDPFEYRGSTCFCQIGDVVTNFFQKFYCVAFLGWHQLLLDSRLLEHKGDNPGIQ